MLPHHVLTEIKRCLFNEFGDLEELPAPPGIDLLARAGDNVVIVAELDVPDESIEESFEIAYNKLRKERDFAFAAIVLYTTKTKVGHHLLEIKFKEYDNLRREYKKFLLFYFFELFTLSIITPRNIIWTASDPSIPLPIIKILFPIIKNFLIGKSESPMIKGLNELEEKLKTLKVEFALGKIRKEEYERLKGEIEEEMRIWREITSIPPSEVPKVMEECEERLRVLEEVKDIIGEETYKREAVKLQKMLQFLGSQRTSETEVKAPPQDKTIVIEKEEKLAKLEQLYKEGKISESAYKKLKEEYERESSTRI